MKLFVGRKQELQLLENAYNNKNAFVMINGRRRVGKTTLVRYFLRNKTALYFTAEEEVDVLSRKRLLKVFADYCGENYYENNKPAQWKDIFKKFAERVQVERKILIIDNIGYLIQGNPSFIKALKKAWDDYFKQASVMLIIIMPNNSILANLENKRNSLVSSVTTQLKLKPVSFVELFRDYPHRDFNQLMSLYAIAGGVPKYWEVFRDCENVSDHMGIVRTEMLNPMGFLFEEPTNLIRQDVWEPSYYHSILKVIAEGQRKPVEMAKALDMKQSAVRHCLNNLVSLGYIETKVSVMDRKTVTNRKRQYYFVDPLMAFWFTFVFSNCGELEDGRDLETFENIKRTFPTYIQYWYKVVCKEIFITACKRGSIPFKTDRVGEFFDKSGDVDIVGIDDQRKRLFLGDCFYNNRQYTMDMFQDFMEECKMMKEFKPYKDYEWVYSAFTSSSFDSDLMDYALITPNIILFNGVTVYKKA